MRTPFLATLLGLNLVACAGNISGGPGDDDIPETCGNGVVDPGEACDGSEGCTATCQFEAVPRLDVTVDKPTINTELLSSNMVTVTLKGAGGYAGQVGVNAVLVDANNNPLTDWVVSVTPATQTLPTDGTGTAVVAFAIPSENKALAATLKITTTTSATTGTHDVDAAVTVANQVTVPMKLTGGQCDYTGLDGTIKLTTGTKIRWMNTEAPGGGNITIHVNASNGVAHEGDPGMAPGDVYEQTVTGTGNPFQWYCHAPGPQVSNLLLQAVAPAP